MDLIVRLRKELSDQGLDAGPETIRWHLAHHHEVTVSRVLVQDLNIRVIDAATGELLRELVLDTTKRYQRTGRPPGPTR